MTVMTAEQNQAIKTAVTNLVTNARFKVGVSLGKMKAKLPEFMKPFYDTDVVVYELEKALAITKAMGSIEEGHKLFEDGKVSVYQLVNKMTILGFVEGGDVEEMLAELTDGLLDRGLFKVFAE